MRRLRALGLLLLVVIVIFVRPGTSHSLPPTPTARGLDVFVHGPSSAPSGGVLPLSIEALGFPTIAMTSPLPGAIIEAAWDPETLKAPNGLTVPSVTVTANSDGQAELLIPMPKGEPQALTLLVSVKSGGRTRVRELPVSRTGADRISLFVSESRVVPGGEISAWALLEKADGGAPLNETPVQIQLFEGGVTRFSAQSSTDPAGSVMFRVPIPRAVEPGLEWTLSARALGPSASATTTTSQRLAAREETPGKPQFSARFDEGAVKAGDDAHFRIRLRDASDEAVANHAVFVWWGARGVEAPAGDLEFQRLASRFLTDGAGEIVGPVKTPTTIALKGTSMRVVAKTEMEGVMLTGDAQVEVGKKHGFVEILPESHILVPGIEQRMMLQLMGDDGEAIVGTFTVDGDGLKATVTTDAHGEAEITWNVPKGIGAKRDVGPCAGGVAAALLVRATEAAPTNATKSSFEGALVGRDGLPVCVPIDRDAEIFLRPDRSVVRAGDNLKIQIMGTNGSRPFSLVAESARGTEARASWLDHGQDAVVVKIPEGASGMLRLSVAGPRKNQPALLGATSVLVLPKIVPQVQAKLLGGRAAPGGKVIIDATIVDENGQGLPGSVALAMIDKLGGGSLGGLVDLDTRRGLCDEVGADRERCDEFLLGDAKQDPLRRALLGSPETVATQPILDPGKSLKADVDATFRSVVRSLEGAIWQASSSPEQLVDVRRKEGSRFVFNPELMTLVTDAMDKPPEMPGGEPIALADLLTIDSQVTYDNVAHRLTRLKLFDVLKAMRDYRLQNQIELAEPVFKEPNALLRRLVHDGQLQRSQLLDPWGGTLEFYKAGGEVMPFMTVTKGYELRSPGPDGKLGTGDDVRDPFERVLKSGTAYAEAVDEDRLVDARYDMRVADSTVEAWSTMLREMTGTELGGLGLSGVGEGGGARGEGIGLGSIGTIGHGSGRGTFGTSRGVAYFSPPKRTDDKGHVTFEVPLGSVETTWQVALVGLPDKARPAVGMVDVPVNLPLSAKVFAGASWVEGDAVDAMITLRNRTDAPLETSVEITPSGAVVLANPGESHQNVSIAKKGATTLHVRTLAKKPGEARLTVKTKCAGLPDDVVTHEIDVKAAGEDTRVAHASWIDAEVDLTPWLSRPSLVAQGPAHLSLERGESPTLEAVLHSVDPDVMVSTESLADVIDLTNQIHGFGISRGGDGDALAITTTKIQEFATGKLDAMRGRHAPNDWVTAARAARITGGGTECPGKSDDEEPLWVVASALDAEPPAESGSVKACWTTFVAETLNRLTTSDDAASVARGVLALVRRSHRAEDAADVARHLRKLVALTPSGSIRLVTPTLATRSIVYAALLATTPESDATTRATLLHWLLVQRDASGSFGSIAATRAAVQALTSPGFVAEPSRRGTLVVETQTEKDGPKTKREVTVGVGERVTIEIPRDATSLVVRPSSVEPRSTGILAQLERAYLRPYSIAPQTMGAPISVDVKWPLAKRGNVANLRVVLKELAPTHSPVELKVPLPPGVMLAEALTGARQVNGVLYFRTTPKSFGETTLVPLRFTLGGTVTVPEATAALLETQAPLAYDRARPLTIEP